MSRSHDFGHAGARLWSSIVDTFDLDGYETEVLARACRAADRVDVLDRIVTRQGEMLTHTNGKTYTNPALVESRLQTLLLARLLSALRLPQDADDMSTRPQYRGPRGPYKLRAVSGGSQ